MTLVNASTGEVVAALTPEDARALTESIKGSAQRLYQLVLEAHEGQAHKALGYATWELYCRTEFDMTRDYAYKLIDQGRIIRAIEAAAGDLYTDVYINEAAARDIRPRLTEVTESIGRRVEAEVDHQADEATQTETRQRIVAEEVTKARQPASTQAIDDWLDEQPDQKRHALRLSIRRMRTAVAKVVADIDPVVAASLIEVDSVTFESTSTATLIDWLTDYKTALDRPLKVVKDT